MWDRIEFLSWAIPAAFFVAAFVAFILYCGAVMFWRTITDPLQRVMLILGFFACCIFAGSKVLTHIYYDDGLADNGSSATNDILTVRWKLNGFLPIPTNTPVCIDYRRTGESIEEDSWVRAGVSPVVGDWEASFVLVGVGSIEYDVRVYTDWVPPVPVQTNGVWKVETHGGNRRDDGIISPIGLRVTGDGEPITPKMENER